MFLMVVTAVLVIPLLALVSVWMWVSWTNRHLIRTASKMQSLLPTVPVLGSLHYALFGPQKLTEWIIDGILNFTSRGINTGCLWAGPYPIICIFGADDIQKISSSSKASERGFEWNAMKFIMGNGLLTAPGDVWKITRPALEPVFHTRNLKQLMPTINNSSRELVNRMCQYDGRGSFDVFNLVIETSLKTICNLIFGPELEFDITSEEFQNLINLLKIVPDIGLQKVMKFWLQCDVIFNFLYKKELQDINTQWERFSTKPLKLSRKNIKFTDEREENYLENYNDLKSKHEGPISLIKAYSILQKNHSEFTEEDLKAEIITMYMAGSDTLSHALSCCFLLLAYHQDIQERLYKEISSVAVNDRDLTANDFHGMPYLGQVYKETLRWSMVIPVTSRRTNDEIKLNSCTIPKDSSLMMFTIGPLLNSKTFSDPKRFNPDHFSPENVKNINKVDYQPFGLGPHGCIGKMYSELYAKVVLVNVVRKFKMSTTVDVYKLKRAMSAFLYSCEGYHISLQRRL